MTTLKARGGATEEEALKVIEAGHPPIAEGVILIDFDATIAPYGYLFDYPEPFPGVAEFVQDLKGNGFTVGVFTSRLSPKWLETVDSTAEDHIIYIEEYGQKYNIPFDFVTAEKIPSIAYIDDKAITFEGSWETIRDIAVYRGWLD